MSAVGITERLKSRMNIAIIRGPFLNKFEMQSYEPLMKYHNITAHYTNDNFFNVEDINIPKRKLRSLESSFGSHVSRLLKLPLHLAGHYYHMVGLEREFELIDIAHTVETFYAFSYQAVKAKRKHRIKVVTTQWENIPFNHESLPLARHIKNAVRKNTDLFVAVTEQAKNALILEGVPSGKIVVIPMGVNLSKFRPSEKDEFYLSSLGLSRDDFIILFIGRLTWEKGIYDLIYAHNKLIKNRELYNRRIKLVIVGKGPAERQITKLTHELEISTTVKLAGSYAYDKMDKIHNLADIFALPSIPTKHWQEQFGMALVEAMACGKPLVSTLCGSIPEVVGESGILVTPGNHLSLYKKLKELIADESKRTELGRNARERAEEKYDAMTIATKLKDIYEKTW